MSDLIALLILNLTKEIQDKEEELRYADYQIQDLRADIINTFCGVRR